MFRVTTIRDHATRAGRAISASTRSVPGPIEFLLQVVLVLVIAALLALLAIPLLVLGAVMVAGALLLAGLRVLLAGVRLRVRDDGRRNVRVIEPTDGTGA